MALLLVEASVLERQSDELADRFGDGDLVVGERPFDVVEEVDQADDLVVRDQGQREATALAVVTHYLTFRRTEQWVTESGHHDGAARLDGKPVAGPVAYEKPIAHPGGVVNAADGGGQADHAISAFEPIDVAVGDLKTGAQASSGRPQNLAETEAGGEVETGVEQQLVALLGELARDAVTR